MEMTTDALSVDVAAVDPGPTEVGQASEWQNLLACHVHHSRREPVVAVMQSDGHWLVGRVRAAFDLDAATRGFCLTTDAGRTMLVSVPRMAHVLGHQLIADANAQPVESARRRPDPGLARAAAIKERQKRLWAAAYWMQ